MQLISQLPPALKALAEKRREEYEKESTEFNMRFSFEWVHTSEGYRFWDYVDESYNLAPYEWIVSNATASNELWSYDGKQLTLDEMLEEYKKLNKHNND